MTSFKKSMVLACAASVLSFGVAMAQTDPNTTTAAPAAGTAAAPADQGAAMTKKPMMKKHMAKKSMKKKKAM